MTSFVVISQDDAGKQYKCAHAWHFRGDIFPCATDKRLLYLQRCTVMTKKIKFEEGGLECKCGQNIVSKQLRTTSVKEIY